MIASEHPFSQALSLGRGRHVCMGNSHVQPRMSLFLPEPIEDVGSHDTSDSAPAPAGHPSLLPLHVYTFVPQQEEAGVCHSCLVNCSVALYPPDRPLAWLDCVPLTAPRNALCMRGSAPPTPPSMLGHPAAFPLGRKTPDLHPSPSSRPSSSLSEEDWVFASFFIPTCLVHGGHPGLCNWATRIFPVGRGLSTSQTFFFFGHGSHPSPAGGQGKSGFLGKMPTRPGLPGWREGVPGLVASLPVEASPFAPMKS